MKSKTRFWILGTGGTAVVAIIATAGYLMFAPGPPSKVVNSTDTDPGMSSDMVAANYMSAYSGKSAGGAAALTDDPQAATAALTKLYQGMGTATVQSSPMGPVTNGSVPYSAEWRAGTLDFRFNGTITLKQVDGNWRVHWAETLIHPSLGKQQSMALRITPGKSTLADRNGAAMELSSLPKALAGDVQSVVGNDLKGTDGARVVTVNADGGDGAVLDDQPGSKSVSYAVTIDPKTQQAAQSAVDGFQGPATIVALQPSTGEVLGMATNAAFDNAGLSPLTGTFPPGSTFKIVTATATLEQGGRTLNSTVSCPNTTTIGQRTIPNEGTLQLGAAPDYAAPMHLAFAQSCNTTFAQLAAGLGADALPTAARQLGLGVDYDIPGLTTNTGHVDSAPDQVDRAVDGFGQGTDMVSPFGMAVVAATVQSGHVPTPVLVRGAQTTATGMVAAPSAGVLSQVQQMMREVCTSGTARGLASIPDVHGKTGTAEIGNGAAHGWFVGYRGDLAFAVLLPNANSSGPAVTVAGTFLRAVG